MQEAHLLQGVTTYLCVQNVLRAVGLQISVTSLLIHVPTIRLLVSAQDTAVHVVCLPSEFETGLQSVFTLS